MVQINSVTVDQLDYLSVLECEVRVLQDRLEPHDTGHIHTAISVLLPLWAQLPLQTRHST